MKENSDGNDTNVGSIGNSIEEDIILLKDFTEGNLKRDKLENYKGSYKMGYFYCKNIQQAIEHILSDYKRVSKENEQLRTEVNSLKKENEELKNDYENLSNSVVVKNHCIKNSIPVSLVKDKIEEIQEEGYWLFTTNRDSDKCVEVLQELLESEE